MKIEHKPEVKKEEPKKYFVIKEGLQTGSDWAGRAGFIVTEKDLTPVK